MGVVYEAYDRDRDQLVALKTLIHFNPAAFYSFKQEFRTLADVEHPNLVHLYELVATEADLAFFTMELVDGTDFLSHVQGTEGERAASVTSEAASRERPTARPIAFTAPVPRPEPKRVVSPANMECLRPALRQLVEGVQALHAAGKLHRDIKPSNVLVSHEGRVVLLDFGVATEVRRVVDENLVDEWQVVGTANYMAPEQGTGDAPTPACDWYSVGVMLYEALVGRPPFTGAMMDVIMMKNTLDPRCPSDAVDGVPEDLESLCLDLLRCDAAERPTGAEIMTRLGGTPFAETLRTSSQFPVADGVVKSVLIGRDVHLGALTDAFRTTVSGRPVTLRVSGRSGMGKSSLVEHFVDGLVERGEAVVLRGRAYERESVPFKAVDSVIDALSRYLLRLNERAEGLSLPIGVGALARVFPVLRRVPSIDEAPEQHSSNPQRLRAAAFSALRELLKTLAKRQPLVIFVDDAQWGDADSSALLLDLMHPLDAPALLFIMAYREEEAQTSAFLLETAARWPERAEVRDLYVGPLEGEDASRLAATLLGSDADVMTGAAAAIARESRGSPFLIEELARSASTGLRVAPVADSLGRNTLGEMVGNRVARLPPGARKFLEIVAVAGKPISVTTVRDAAESEGAPDEIVSFLRARRFVRTGLRDGNEMVESSHDRIREAIVSMLSETVVRAHHSRLAVVLEARPGLEPEAVAHHLFGAGDNERAAQYASRAAESAIATLAFGQAARLLKLTLATMEPSSPEAQRVRRRLADALKWAGHSSEAGTVYLEAVEGAEPSERATLEREAADQLLVSGRLEEGAAVLGRVLAAVHVRIPRSPLSALFWLIVYRLWLSLIGIRFKERRPEEIPPQEKMRLQAMWAAAQGISLANIITGACMEARYLIYALRAGDRMHLLRAVTFEVAHLASIGGPQGKRERELTQLAERLAENLTNVDVGIAVESMRGVSLFLRGHWRRTREVYDVEYAKYRSARAGSHATASLFSLYSLLFLGELRELARRRTRMLIEAEQRGDLHMTVNLRASCAFSVWLAADDPSTARRQVREAMGQWPNNKYLLQHWQAFVCEAEIDLYMGDGAAAYDRIVREQRAVNRSLILNVQFARGAQHFLRGRAAVASTVGRPELLASRLAEARAIVRRLERERMPWMTVMARQLEAAVDNAAGDRSAMLASLRAVIDLGRATDMGMYTQVARYRLGSVLGTDEGVALMNQARDAMLAEDIKSPERWARLIMPGTWPEGRPSVAS